MVICRRTTRSCHVKQFKRDFDKIVTAYESKSECTPDTWQVNNCDEEF
ncbi:MAG: hypothetical protein LLF83_01330 [Methanobacterium sp.]|nr:hypothetical protein [Methanobacterium sp.]